ncbi:ABC transporter substrate-binding protein [Actinopolymorpha sp. NPDC004070]|uniref:ABC transporter substrate-binding protein n=1 Tax=Actinopolymorpha sp. NPDC004070 TaxID=3154548 RepID=UPI0033B50D6E
MPSHFSSAPQLTRRDVLAAMGAGAGAWALAGCRQGGDPGAAGAPTEFHGGTAYQVPPKGHFNLMDGVTDAILGDHFYLDLILAPGAMYRWKEQKWEPMLLEKWHVDEAARTFTCTLRSGLKWSDGRPITSKDAVTTFWCLRIMRNSLWDYLDDVSAPDERTVVLTMKKPSTVVERYVLRQHLHADATYGPWARRAQRLFGSGKDLDTPEGKQLNEEFQAFRPERAVVSGPFDYSYDTITNAQLTLVKNPHGYAADRIAFDKVIVHNGETTTITPVVLAKRLDYATHGFPVATEKQLVRKGFRIIRPPVYSGPALLFNLARLREFADPAARRAVAHAIDRDLNGKVSLARSGRGVRYLAGFSDNLVPQWMSAADRDRLDPYEFDQDKAAGLLTGAGWRRQGKRWLTPQGKPAEYEITFPAEYADWSASGENAARQLSDFGIRVTPRGVTESQQPIDVDKGNFSLAIQSWGTSAHPHPHFAFVQDLFIHNIPVAANQGGRGMGFALRQATKVRGRVDLQRLVIQAGEGLDEAAQRATVTTLGLAFNELLPMIPLFERHGNNPALEGVRVTAWPPDSDPLLQNSPYADNFTIMLLYAGRLRPEKGAR